MAGANSFHTMSSLTRAFWLEPYQCVLSLSLSHFLSLFLPVTPSYTHSSSTSFFQKCRNATPKLILLSLQFSLHSLFHNEVCNLNYFGPEQIWIWFSYEVCMKSILSFFGGCRRHLDVMTLNYWRRRQEMAKQWDCVNDHSSFKISTIDWFYLIWEQAEVRVLLDGLKS